MNNEVKKIDEAVKADLKAAATKLVALQVNIKTGTIHNFITDAVAEANKLGKKAYDEIHHVVIAIDDEVKHFSLDELKNLLGFGKIPQDVVMHQAPVPQSSAESGAVNVSRELVLKDRPDLTALIPTTETILTPEKLQEYKEMAAKLKALPKDGDPLKDLTDKQV